MVDCVDSVSSGPIPTRTPALAYPWKALRSPCDTIPPAQRLVARDQSRSSLKLQAVSGLLLSHVTRSGLPSKITTMLWTRLLKITERYSSRSASAYGSEYCQREASQRTCSGRESLHARALIAHLQSELLDDSGFARLSRAGEKDGDGLSVRFEHEQLRPPLSAANRVTP